MLLVWPSRPSSFGKFAQTGGEEERAALERQLSEVEEQISQYEATVSSYKRQGKTLQAEIDRLALKLKSLICRLNPLKHPSSDLIRDCGK